MWCSQHAPINKKITSNPGFFPAPHTFSPCWQFTFERWKCFLSLISNIREVESMALQMSSSSPHMTQGSAYYMYFRIFFLKEAEDWSKLTQAVTSQSRSVKTCACVFRVNFSKPITTWAVLGESLQGADPSSRHEHIDLLCCFVTMGVRSFWVVWASVSALFIENSVTSDLHVASGRPQNVCCWGWLHNMPPEQARGKKSNHHYNLGLLGPEVFCWDSLSKTECAFQRKGGGNWNSSLAWWTPAARWFLAGTYILSLMLLLIPCSISAIDPKVVRRVLLGPMSLL